MRLLHESLFQRTRETSVLLIRTYLMEELFESNVRGIGFLHVYVRKSYVQNIVVFPEMRENHTSHNTPILRCWVKGRNL